MPISQTENIEAAMEWFRRTRGNALDRGASFDFCFNYFQSFKDSQLTEHISSGENLQLTCFHLGFFLASWGMFRGKAFLAQKSVKFYEPMIHLISKFDKRIWSIDVDKYDSGNIELLLDFKKGMLAELEESKKLTASPDSTASELVVTKTMHGVFGNIPAFDTVLLSWLWDKRR